MLRVSTRVLVGHMHNALVDNLSAGEPLEPATYAALFPAPDLFDDRELTAALVGARVPRKSSISELAGAAAIALAVGTGAPGPADGPLTRQGGALQLNPLYVDGTVRWPSERYETEYGPLVTYPPTTQGLDMTDTPALARRRVLVDLPERW